MSMDKNRPGWGWKRAYSFKVPSFLQRLPGRGMQKSAVTVWSRQRVVVSGLAQYLCNMICFQTLTAGY
jgi:hypothetical protein